MERITEINRYDKDILIADYSGCGEAEMLTIISEVKKIILQRNKPIAVIAIFGEQTHVTTNFMDYVRKATPDVLHLIEKQAVVGLNPVKRMILKGYNYFFHRNVRAFETKEEAIDFVVDDGTTDQDMPDYMR